MTQYSKSSRLTLFRPHPSLRGGETDVAVQVLIPLANINLDRHGSSTLTMTVAVIVAIYGIINNSK